MFNFLKKYFFNLVISGIFLVTNGEAADDDRKFPSLFAVYQQQGPTCPYIPFENLKKIREMRERDPEGKIAFQDSDYVTKVQSYAWFLPRIRALDTAYGALRTAGGHYAEYEQGLRLQGIKSNRRYDKKGTPVGRIDWLSTDQARRENYTPYNIKVEESPYYGMRWLPLFHKDDGQVYFYDYESKTPIKLEQVGPNDITEKDHALWLTDGSGNLLAAPATCRFEDDMLKKMGISRGDMNRLVTSSPFLGSQTTYYLQSSSQDVYSQEVFYNVGTYQHILFACGLSRDNEDITGEDSEWMAYKEFHEVFQENPINPWRAIHKNDLFEYHLANIFKANPDLKGMAQKAVNYYNNPWHFYQESFELYDSPQEPRIKFSDKQTYLPGEDQMLAYFFSSQLRFTWGASISLEALVAIEELDEELGRNKVKVLKALSFVPGVPSVRDILAKASEKKFKVEGQKYSFLDVWEAIKAKFMELPSQAVDFVSFSGHGCVISFDDGLVQRQRHENRAVADRLGFEMWESLYEKGIRPFYQKPGKEADLITFP